jgi:hypothetical protein
MFGEYCRLRGPVVAQEIGCLHFHIGMRDSEMQRGLSSGEPVNKAAIVEFCGTQPDAADETYMHR